MSTEDRQLYMFHFRCPACAASPPRMLLREYLHRWGATPPERLRALLGTFSGALTEVAAGQSRWLTKKFAAAVDRLQRALRQLPFDPPARPDSALCRESSGLRFDAQCPVCGTPPGFRRQDNYFTEWPRACKVQTGNLLYETGLILWAVLLGLPAWAPGSFLRQLNLVRREVRRAGTSLSLMECPQCGRFTNGLYGHPDPEANGYCRWCLDMGGGAGLRITVTVDSDGRPDFDLATADPSAPAENCWDILPPEVRRRLKS